MRILLAILVTAGLLLNPGSGFVAAAYAKAPAAAMGGMPAHPMHPPHQMAHGTGTEDCHKHHSRAPLCKCCDKNAKCTHQSCTCLKCFSVLAEVRPFSQTLIEVAALPGPDAFEKPPGSVRQPPPPPPQS